MAIETHSYYEPGSLAAPATLRPEERGPPVEILFDRAAFLREAILHLVALVRERRSIRDGNLARIDAQQCDAHSRMFQLPGGFVGTNKDVDRLRAQLETDHLRLELEKSKEQAACWKDMVSLQSDLTEMLREYRSLVEKLEVLSDRRWPRPTFEELLREEGPDRSPRVVLTDEPPTEMQLRQLRRIP